MQCNAKQYNLMKCSVVYAVQYNLMQYNAIQYYTTQIIQNRETCCTAIQCNTK